MPQLCLNESRSVNDLGENGEEWEAEEEAQSSANSRHYPI